MLVVLSNGSDVAPAGLLDFVCGNRGSSRGLVDAGIFERRPYSEPAVRERNEYRLTAKGSALFPVYVALMTWGNQWTGQLPGPRRRVTIPLSEGRWAGTTYPQPTLSA